MAIDEQSNEIRAQLKEWLQSGAPVEWCGQKLVEGCSATIVRSYQTGGQVIESPEYVDFPTRLAYLKVVMEAAGYTESEESKEGGTLAELLGAAIERAAKR